MFTSHYHFYARFLQAPGTFIINIIILAVISRKSELKRRELIKITNASFEGISSVSERQSLNAVGNIQERDYLFDWRWLIDIFYDKIGSESTEVNSQPKYKLNLTKVWVFILQISLNVLVFWAQVESFYFAGEWKENIGVIMSLFSIKPIITFIIFYFAVGSTVNLIEGIGMGIAMASVFIISVSKFDFGLLEEHSKEENIDFLISALLMVPVVCLIWIRNLLFKLFYKSGEAFDEIFVVQILINFVVSFVMLIIGIVFYIFFNFRFDTIDLIYGIIGGVLNLICSIMSVIVVVKGHPGPADALVETSSIFLTIIDAIVFFRVPNIFQYIGIGLSFISTGFIIVGSHHK